MKKFNVVFGEIIQENGSIPHIPHIEVVIKDEEGTRVTTGYLSPFRGYCFQVSGDTKGTGDYGASDVLDLRGIRKLESNVRQAWLKGQAALAIEGYLSKYYALAPCERAADGEEFTIIRPNYNPFVGYKEEPDNYSEFINKCDEWLFG